MSLDVWFKNDVRNILVALHTANNAAIVTLATDPYQKRIYRQGYTDALVSLAVAFGISIQSMPQVTTITDGGEEK